MAAHGDDVSMIIVVVSRDMVVVPAHAINTAESLI